jgi:copper chaperone NosL
MHTLHTRDFVEFIVLPYLIGGFAVLGLLVAIINRRAGFFGWVGLFGLIAFTSMIDFYRWEYNYGHNLDPEAPIRVPGMAYQPPLLGYKQLLNFGAYSIPDSGGWLFVGVGLVLAGFCWVELRGKRKRHSVPPVVALLLVVGLTGGLGSCKSGPQPIRLGKDHCEYCMMTFSNTRFGGEICTRKGRVYKFDDLRCLRELLRAGRPAKGEIAGIWLIDFEKGGWLRAEDAYLLQSAAFHTPMGGDIAAFADSLRRQQYCKENKGQSIVWKDVYQ